MKLEHGNMWDIYKETNFFIFTGNSFIKQNGALVMGRGMAKEVRDNWPGIDLAIGKEISDKANGGFYGLILGKKIGVFQVKRHFKDIANFSLIEASTHMLNDAALKHPDIRFDMNFPGIGNGHLAYNDVLPIIQNLPSNVHIWSFK